MAMTAKGDAPSLMYVIGPVTGVEFGNRPAFEAAAKRLGGAFGCEVRIPHDVVPAEAEWPEAMRLSIKAMMDADAVAMLPGWERSVGANIEYDICRRVDIECMPLDLWMVDARRIRRSCMDCQAPRRTPR